LYWLSKSFHIVNRSRRRLIILLAVLGPGIITMVADNDAGGISTYSVTGSRYGFKLLWIFFLLVPMAYFIQEMTVRRNCRPGSGGSGTACPETDHRRSAQGTSPCCACRDDDSAARELVL